MEPVGDGTQTMATTPHTCDLGPVAGTSVCGAGGHDPAAASVRPTRAYGESASQTRPVSTRDIQATADPGAVPERLPCSYQRRLQPTPYHDTLGDALLLPDLCDVSLVPRRRRGHDRGCGLSSRSTSVLATRIFTHTGRLGACAPRATCGSSPLTTRRHRSGHAVPSNTRATTTIPARGPGLATSVTDRMALTAERNET